MIMTTLTTYTLADLECVRALVEARRLCENV